MLHRSDDDARLLADAELRDAGRADEPGLAAGEVRAGTLRRQAAALVLPRAHLRRGRGHFHPEALLGRLWQIAVYLRSIYSVGAFEVARSVL